MIYILIAIVLILTEQFYIRLMDKTSLFSALQDRRKDERPIWSGAGLLFYVGMLIFSVIHNFMYPWFFISISLLAVVGFWNAIKPVPTFIQHMALWGSLLVMYLDLNFYETHSWILILILLMSSLLIMYAFRAMDGVNRISGGSSFVVLLVLGFINARMVPFMDAMYLWIAVLTSVILCFANLKFRMRAFGGEAGAGMLAIIVLFALGKLITVSHDMSYQILLIVYFVDTLLTLFYRIARHESIIEAEGNHIYQLLVVKRNFSPVAVSAMFASVQSLVVAGYLILFPYRWIYFVVVILLLCLFYVLLERRINNFKE